MWVEGWHRHRVWYGVEKGDRQVKGVGWIVGKYGCRVWGEGGDGCAGVDGQQRQVWRWKGFNGVNTGVVYGGGGYADRCKDG